MNFVVDWPFERFREDSLVVMANVRLARVRRTRCGGDSSKGNFSMNISVCQRETATNPWLGRVLRRQTPKPPHKLYKDGSRLTRSNLTSRGDDHRTMDKVMSQSNDIRVLNRLKM